MILLTFVGTGRYENVRYQWENHDLVETEYFARALSSWLQPKEILVFLTNEAEKHENWTGLKCVLHEYNVNPVLIPSGKSSDELWEVFNNMVSEIDEGSEVVIDITHAFRSIPMLALVAAAFMTKAKGIQIKHILYGAFEAKDPTTGIVPVYDLTPFLTLLDWMNATDQFIQNGDSRHIAKILKTRNDAIRRDSAATNGQDLPTKLSSLSNAMTRLSQALLTVRTNEIPDFANRLRKSLDKASDDSEKWVQPLDVLFEKIREKYAPFQMNDLDSQRELIKWYVENDHVVQAITLAREWLVSWACNLLKVDVMEDRYKVEACIGNVLHKNNKESEVEYPANWNLVLSGEKDFLDTWSFVRDVRNDVAHCGIRKNPDPSNAVFRKAQEIPKKLCEFRINF